MSDTVGLAQRLIASAGTARPHLDPVAAARSVAPRLDAIADDVAETRPVLAAALQQDAEDALAVANALEWPGVLERASPRLWERRNHLEDELYDIVERPVRYATEVMRGEVLAKLANDRLGPGAGVEDAVDALSTVPSALWTRRERGKLAAYRLDVADRTADAARTRSGTVTGHDIAAEGAALASGDLYERAARLVNAWTDDTSATVAELRPRTRAHGTLAADDAAHAARPGSLRYLDAIEREAHAARVSEAASRVEVEEALYRARRTDWLLALHRAAVS